MALGSALVALLLAAPPDAGLPRARIAVVPFENVTRAESARATVMETIEATLARKGYEVVGGPAVEEFLRTRRIRYLDAIATDRVGELLALLGADACLTGTILSWDADEADPGVALAARLVTREGELLWSDAGGVTAADTQGLLGLGRAPNVRALADRLVERLLGPLPAIHLARVRASEPSWWKAWSGPRVFRSRDLAGKPLHVAVLPLANLSESRDAPRTLEAILQHRLGERAAVTVVGAADLRAAVVKAGLRTPGRLTVDQLRVLAKEAGATLFLRGTVLYWGPSRRDVTVPEVELYLSLLDAESGRTVWSGLHRRDGLEYEGLLLRGAVRDPTSLASRVVSELLDAFTRP